MEKYEKISSYCVDILRYTNPVARYEMLFSVLLLCDKRLFTFAFKIQLLFSNSNNSRNVKEQRKVSNLRILQSAMQLLFGYSSCCFLKNKQSIKNDYLHHTFINTNKKYTIAFNLTFSIRSIYYFFELEILDNHKITESL